MGSSLGRFSAALILGSIQLALACAPAPAAPAIRWEVANRFRLFKKEAQFRALLDVYQALPEASRRNSPAFSLEVELENRVLARRLDGFGNKDALAHYGWASALINQTCFSQAGKSHRDCALATRDDYLQPAAADILVSLVDGPTTGTCDWSVNDSVPVSQPCGAQPVRLPRVPLGTPLALTVASAGAPIASTSGEPARSIVIVGLGDSFASGEGNPDRPAGLGGRYSTYRNTSKAPRDRGFQLYALRPGSRPDRIGAVNEAAYWLNIQCHRSLYSQQLKAALQVALENPHVAVTYLGYACTGAKVEAGILGYWDGRNDVATSIRDDSPQLMRLLRDICRDPEPYQAYRAPRAGFESTRDLRPCANRTIGTIDALLLSIGGNDIGFSGVIANESVATRDYPLARSLKFRLWRSFTDPISFGTAEGRIPSLQDKYRRLSTELARLAGVDSTRIIQTGYPQMLQTGATSDCGVTRAGMDVHQILALSKADTGRNSVSFVNLLNSRIRQFRIGEMVDAFASAFAGHALCTGGLPGGGTQPDGMRFPNFNRTNGQWTPFAPSLWRAYTPRNRWFVTPNDAFLTGNYMRTADGGGGDPDPRGITQPLLAATLSGAFHPNALGHAAIADSVLATLRGKLGLPAP